MSRIGSKATIQGEAGFVTMQAIDRLEKNATRLEDLQTMLRGERPAAVQASDFTATLTLGNWIEQLTLEVNKARPDSPVLLSGSAEVKPGEMTGETVTLMVRFRRGATLVFEAVTIQPHASTATAVNKTVLIPISVYDFDAPVGKSTYALDVQWSANDGSSNTDPSVVAARANALEVF